MTGTSKTLVNNAGVIQRASMLDMSAEDFRRVVDIDLNAPFIVSKACLPGMIAKGHGKIINICSMMSELGHETIAGYAAAKGGLKMPAKAIYSEFGEVNIQCNGIGPGYIATPQTAPLRETQPDGSRHPFDQLIIAKVKEIFGPLIARFIAANASGRRPVYGTAAAFCSLSIGASGQAPLHQTVQRGLTRARRRPCSRRRWRRGCYRTFGHRPARGWQHRLQPDRRPAWYWDDSPWQAPACRHRR